MPSPNAQTLSLSDLPGHGIRRLQQIAVAIFMQETAAHDITPVQFGALKAVCDAPGIDQRSLARSIGLDTSTVAGVVDRLEARGLMRRSPSPSDRRVRLLTLTDSGLALLQAAVSPMLRAQERILAPLAPAEREVFMGLLQRLVEANNGLSRAPSD